MRKIFALTFALVMGCTSANALEWWLQETICRLDGTRCYGSLSGPGYDAEMWDAVSNCRGMKYICPAATTDRNDSEPVLMGRLAIANGTGIDPDYDTSLLNTAEGCFGMRRANGATVSVNGVMTPVFCPGILSNPDEYLEYGEVEYDVGHPTCAELAEYGYVASLNGKCYGKYYDTSKYYIECGTGVDLMPARLIVLNGADVESVANGAPTDKSDTDNLFDKMFSTSQSQKKIYFNK